MSRTFPVTCSVRGFRVPPGLGFWATRLIPCDVRLTKVFRLSLRSAQSPFPHPSASRPRWRQLSITSDLPQASIEISEGVRNRQLRTLEFGAVVTNCHV